MTALRLLSPGGGANCADWSACLAFARNKFEKYFSHKAKQLLASFPVNKAAAEGEKEFWTYPKRAPRPVEFNPSSDLHLGFVASLAVAWAAILGVKVERESLGREALRRELAKVKVSPFVARTGKAVVTDESVSRAEAEEAAGGGRKDEVDSAAFASSVRAAKRTALSPGSVAQTLRDDLAARAARLRCRVYGLPEPTGAETRRMSRRLCPCPATTVEVLADLACLELRRMWSTPSSASAPSPHDWWVSLSPGALLLRSESKRASPLPGLGHLKRKGLTLWDRLEVRGRSDWTLQKVLEALDEQFGVAATLVVQGTKMVFVEALPTHAKRKAKL